MGIILRVKNLMKANANSVLNKLENPEKMMDQYLTNVEKNLYQVKAHAAEILAAEKSSEREVLKCEKVIVEMEEYAVAALCRGDEADAYKFLEQKAQEESRLDELKESLSVAQKNTCEILSLHDKMNREYLELKNKNRVLKAKSTLAKTKAGMNSYLSAKSNYLTSNIQNFERMEERINSMLDTANAAEELEKRENINSLTPLKEKYDAEKTKSALEKELELLKDKISKKAV